MENKNEKYKIIQVLVKIKNKLQDSYDKKFKSIDKKGLKKKGIFFKILSNIPFFTLIILKLTKIISWSWYAILLTSPFILLFILSAIVLFFGILSIYIYG